MMRFAIWLTVVLSAFGAPASTAKAMRCKPTSEAYKMRVSVVFGDRSTQFFITSWGVDGVLKISNDRGLKGKKKLDESEIVLLLQTYTKLPAGDNIPTSCYRSRVDIVMVRPGQPQEVKASCFAVEFPAEPAFRHFVNLLSQPF